MLLKVGWQLMVLCWSMDRPITRGGPSKKGTSSAEWGEASPRWCPLVAQRPWAPRGIQSVAPLRVSHYCRGDDLLVCIGPSPAPSERRCWSCQCLALQMIFIALLSRSQCLTLSCLGHHSAWLCLVLVTSVLDSILSWSHQCLTLSCLGHISTWLCRWYRWLVSVVPVLDSILSWSYQCLTLSCFGHVSAWLYLVLDTSVLDSILSWSYQCLSLQTMMLDCLSHTSAWHSAIAGRLC